MRQFFMDHGLDSEKSGFYELPAIEWPLYSATYKTNLEIEIDRKHHSLNVFFLFVLDAEGIVERTPMMVLEFDLAWNYRNGFIAWALKDDIAHELILRRNEEREAYVIESEKAAEYLAAKLLARHLLVGTRTRFFSSSLSDEEAHAVISTSSERWEPLLAMLNKEPNLVHALKSHEFEELVAELLARQGLRVRVTQRTRDGGKDILAFADTPLGEHLYYVECKKYAADRPVDVSLVRQLAGVVEVERATAGMLVTTSRFTDDARQFIRAIPYRMSLKDFSDFVSWLRSSQSPR